MKIKKGVLIGSIICFVFAFIYLCIGLVANNHIFANEENTTELSGTVVMVEEDDDGYLVLLEGEVVPIRIFFNTIVNEQYIQSLSEGDTIRYSILNDILEMVQEGNGDLILPVCAMDTEQGAVATMESYNSTDERNKTGIMRISISVCAVLLVIAAVLLVIYIRRLKRSKDIR